MILKINITIFTSTYKLFDKNKKVNYGPFLVQTLNITLVFPDWYPILFVERFVVKKMWCVVLFPFVPDTYSDKVNK